MKKYFLLFLFTSPMFKVAFSATPNPQVKNTFADNLTAISQLAWPILVFFIVSVEKR